ncbi:transposase [Streptomyces broussonetiae]|uniref:transposase n=1 Tax=Streptomyces broussonetiae TaxID=2686304 RepID=UPI00131B970B|nr:transposase [Streptomyces broussonetiae]
MHEFAFGRGRRYGTILVDVETHQLVDVLPDRSSETLATWLRDHAVAEVVCRDRASAYTRAVKEVAPGAGSARLSPRPTECALDRFKSCLQAQFAAGHTNAKELYGQICERGFSGGYSTLSRYVRTLRDGTAVPAPEPIPSPRTISGWIMRLREKLSPRQAVELERVRLAFPDITEACNIARAFTDLVRNRRGHLLTESIRQGEQCGQPSIRSFAGFLRQDLDAVTAGLILAYSSGVVEGHVCRVKLLKRSMYSRASFALVRARILARP